MSDPDKTQTYVLPDTAETESEIGSDNALTSDHKLVRARFVGRTDLLQQLTESFRRCSHQKELAFITLTGEPGVGKTRLAAEFARSVRQNANARVLVGTAHSGVGPAYEVITTLLKERFGLGQQESPEEVRRKIQYCVAQNIGERHVAEVTHLLAHLMQCPYEDSPILESLAQQAGQLELRTFIAVKRFLESDAKRGPLLLVADGMEQAVFDSVNLLHYLADGLQHQPVMIIATGRPTLFRTHPNWGTGEFSHQRIDLDPLSPIESQALLCELLNNEDTPEEIKQVGRQQLRGSPQAIYDFARYLLDSKVVTPAAPHWKISESVLRTIQLPRSPEEVLKARIAALPPPEHELLAIAATIGEVFWTDAIVAVVRTRESHDTLRDGPPLTQIATAGDGAHQRVANGLHSLIDRRIVVACTLSSISGEQEFRFTNPAARDLCYDSIDPVTRTNTHAIIAQWLELHPEGRRPDRQELIGRHLQRSGDNSGAAMRYRRAADTARAGYYNHKAIRLYQRALGCIDEGDIAARIHVLHDLGSVHELTGNFDAALDAFERMLRLAWLISSRPKTAVAFDKIGRIWREKGTPKIAQQYFERALELFSQSDDKRGVGACLADLGLTHWILGNFDRALDCSAKGLDLRRELGDKRSIAASLNAIGQIEADRGLFEQAEACYRQAITLLNETKDHQGRLLTQSCLAALRAAQGELATARQQWEELLDEAERIGAIPLQVAVLIHLGESAEQLNHFADARQRLQRALVLAQELEDQRSTVDALAVMSRLELHEGHHDAARTFATECLTHAQRAQIPECIAKAAMALGEVHAATLFDTSSPSDSDQTAEAHFTQATTIFRQLGHQIELAKSLRRLGEYHIERGAFAPAKAALNEAWTLFKQMGLRDAQKVHAVLTDFNLLQK